MDPWSRIGVAPGVCSGDDFVCHIALLLMIYVFPPLLAVFFASRWTLRRYWREQTQRNRHVLHALWEESKLVNYDCLQWAYFGNAQDVKKKISHTPDYRPYTVDYAISQVALDEFMKNMPGVDSNIIRAGIRYQYDSSAASALVKHINSETWKEMSADQKKAAVEDIFHAMNILRLSSKCFHMLLSDHLRRQPDYRVKYNSPPRNNVGSR